MKGWVPLLVLALACGGSAADHERLGDTAYGLGEYGTALEEYRAAARDGDRARVWAKLAAAALKSADLREASEAYSRMAGADPTRATEAARGLEQVARGAEQSQDGVALRQAVEALRHLAPERVSARQTVALVRSGQLEPAEAAGIGPLALAAAGDAAQVDQMLVMYGAALQRTTACSEAAEVYLVALRRSREPSLRERAGDGVGACGLQLGLEALLVGEPLVASQWFQRVVAVDSDAERGRRALIGLGDARVAQGDILGAAIAYQDAMKRGASDSIVAMAEERLTRLGAPQAPADSQ